MRLFRRWRHNNLYNFVLGSDRPYLFVIQVSSPSVRYMGIVYLSFCYAFFCLLLNDDPDLVWHKRAFLDRVTWSEADATVLGVTIIGTELVLGGGLKSCLLWHRSSLLGLLSRFMTLFPRTTVFQQRGLFWRKRRWIRAWTSLYMSNQSVSSFPCQSSRLMLVITSVAARDASANASFL